MAANTEKNVSKAKAKGNLISSFVVGARSGLKMSLKIWHQTSYLLSL